MALQLPRLVSLPLDCTKLRLLGVWLAALPISVARPTSRAEDKQHIAVNLACPGFSGQSCTYSAIPIRCEASFAQSAEVGGGIRIRQKPQDRGTLTKKRCVGH